MEDLVSITAASGDEASPASKRFRTLIQELFSLVEELYLENDKLCSHAAEIEELRKQNDTLRDALLWLGSTELQGDTAQKLKSNIRRKVFEALNGKDEDVGETPQDL